MPIERATRPDLETFLVRDEGIDIELPYNGTLHLESYENSEYSVGAVVGRWGEKWERDQIDSQIRALYGLDENGRDQIVGDSSGFKNVHRPQAELSYRELTHQSIAVTGLHAAEVIKLNGWKPSDVGGLFIGGDALPIGKKDKGLSLKRQLLAASGLQHLDESKQVSIKALACNSGADELLHALVNPDFRGRPVVIVGISTLFNELSKAKYRARPLSLNIDPFSLQVFSYGAAAFGIIPGETMSIIEDLGGEPITIVDEEFDTEQSLAAITPFDSLIDHSEPYRVRQEIAENVVIGMMPRPRHKGRALDMNSYLTSKLFPKTTTKRVLQFWDQFRQAYPEGKFDELIMHHASYAVGQSVHGKMIKAGIDVPFYWTVDDGNAPPATTLTHLARRLPYLGNKNIMVVSFGGGATYTIFGLRLGPDGASPDIVSSLKVSI